MLASDGKLLTGTSSGSLQLWLVDKKTTPPAVALNSSMEIDSGTITSINFSSKLELVRLKLFVLNFVFPCLHLQGVVGSSSGTAWYINWAELSKMKLIGGHSKEISAVAFSADSSLIASSAQDGSLAVWKSDTREQLVLFQAPHKACCSVTFAPTLSRHMGISNEGGEVTPPPVLPALVAGYSDGTVRVFDVSKGKMLRKMQPHAQPVTAVSFFIDGQLNLIVL